MEGTYYTDEDGIILCIECAEDARRENGDVDLLRGTNDTGEPLECDCCEAEIEPIKDEPHTKILTGEVIWEAFREMFPPHSTGPWMQAPEDTKEKYNKAAERLNMQLGLTKETQCSTFHSAHQSHK
jgi:hypothetical protein